MTEIERLEGELASKKVIVSFLESRLEVYRRQVIDLNMKLNRARRLEREAVSCSKES